MLGPSQLSLNVGTRMELTNSNGTKAQGKQCSEWHNDHRSHSGPTERLNVEGKHALVCQALSQALFSIRLHDFVVSDNDPVKVPRE